MLTLFYILLWLPSEYEAMLRSIRICHSLLKLVVSAAHVGGLRDQT